MVSIKLILFQIHDFAYLPTMSVRSTSSSTAAPLCSTTESSSSLSPTASGVEQKMTKKEMLKDPAAPKRPISSFFLFGEEERPRVTAELGNISVGKVGKELGRRWAVLDKDRKGRYETIHMEAKARYKEEMKSYQPSQQFLEEKTEQASNGLHSISTS